MKLTILILFSMSLSAFSITYNTEDELSNNLSVSADSVENSLAVSQEENKELNLEEQQFAAIINTLNELNEI